MASFCTSNKRDRSLTDGSDRTGLHMNVEIALFTMQSWIRERADLGLNFLFNERIYSFVYNNYNLVYTLFGRR